jgi:hypothetical protein
MDRNKTINMFCTILNDFLNDMYRSYPDPSLLILLNATKAMVSVSPLMLVQNFMFCIEDYTEKIRTRDTSFFLGGELANNLQGGSYSFLVDEINKVAEIWRRPETSDKTKESIWKYFEILEKLGSKIIT